MTSRERPAAKYRRVNCGSAEAGHGCPGADRIPQGLYRNQMGDRNFIDIPSNRAAAFWALVLGGFAASGFHASDPAGGAVETLVITPECAWPYGVNDHDAKAVYRMYYHLTPEQRTQVLKTRR